MPHIENTDIGWYVEDEDAGIHISIVSTPSGQIIGAVGKERWGIPMFGTVGILGYTASLTEHFNVFNIEQVI